MDSDQDICVLCRKDGGQMNLVGNKGLNTIIRASIEKQENYIHEELDCNNRKVQCMFTAIVAGLLIYERGQILFPTLKNWGHLQMWCLSGKHAVFCLKPVDMRNRIRDQVCQVCTLPIHANFIQCAKESNDDWGQAVLAKLETCNYLVAAVVVYHSSCMTNFKLNKDENSGTKGRPRNVSMTKAFENVCDWLENSTECQIHAIQELHDNMVEDSGGVAYTLKSFREKLKDRYNEHVYFVKLAGCKGESLCFKEMTDYFLWELKDQGSDKKGKVVKTAPKIVKEEIRQINFSKDHYPGVGEIEESEKWIPDSLQLFMKVIVPTGLKKVSLIQCIVQAARARTIIAHRIEHW